MGNNLETIRVRQPMPAVFVSHGSPMVALETGPFQQALSRFGERWRPNAILVVSAHWTTGDEIRVTSAPKHSTIHDFSGFPRLLYELRYDAPGSPELAARIAALLNDVGFAASLDARRGLDHGAWVPLRFLYPDASVPVVQVSLPFAVSPEELFRLGGLLASLRDEGMMILATGGIVHNLARLDFAHQNREPFDWAVAFDEWFSETAGAWGLAELFRYFETAPHAAYAVPTPEHFHPVFVAVGAATPGAKIESIFEGFQYGSLSMRSFTIA